MTAKEQNKLVGIFLLAHGALYAFMMIVIGLVYAFIGAAMFASARRNEEQFAGVAMAVIMIVVFVFIALVFALPQIIGGYKMLKERPNARTWGIVASVIACLSFPLGTAAGVFGMVFLFGESGRQFYFGPQQPSYYPPQPPPPSSWQ
jgi:uncharacterized membrane protein